MSLSVHTTSRPSSGRADQHIEAGASPRAASRARGPSSSNENLIIVSEAHPSTVIQLPYVEYLESLGDTRYTALAYELRSRPRQTLLTSIIDECNGNLDFHVFAEASDYAVAGPFEASLKSYPDSVGHTADMWLADVLQNHDGHISMLDRLGAVFDIDPEVFRGCLEPDHLPMTWPRPMWYFQHKIGEVTERVRISLSSGRSDASVLVLTTCQQDLSFSHYTVILLADSNDWYRFLHRPKRVRPSMHDPTANGEAQSEQVLSELFQTMLKSLSAGKSITGITYHPFDFILMYAHLLALQCAEEVQGVSTTIEDVVRPTRQRTTSSDNDEQGRLDRREIREALKDCGTAYRALRTTISSLQILQDLLEGELDTDTGGAKAFSTACIVRMKATIADYQEAISTIERLKVDCQDFLNDQIQKLALAEARTSVQQAYDVARLSYLGFIFVPLSLASSFFGTNLRQLGAGHSELWVFIVTALAITAAALISLRVSQVVASRERGYMRSFYRRFRYSRVAIKMLDVWHRGTRKSRRGREASWSFSEESGVRAIPVPRELYPEADADGGEEVIDRRGSRESRREPRSREQQYPEVDRQ